MRGGPIDSLEHPSPKASSGVQTSRLGAVFSWLISPLVRFFDGRYGARFEELTSRQISLDSSIRLVAAQAESSAEATARLAASFNLLEDLAGRNRQAMESLRSQYDQLAEDLVEHDDRCASLARSIEALDATSKSATKSINTLEKVAPRVKTLESRSVEYGDRMGSLSESVKALDQTSISATKSINTLKKVAPRVKTLEGRSVEDGDRIDSLSQSIGALEERSKRTLESIEKHEQVVNDHRRLAQDLDSARATLESFEVQLAAALRILEGKSDIDTVSSVDDTQKRVLAHLAELQDDHDAVKLASASVENRIRQLADRSEQLQVQASDLPQTLADLQVATDSAREMAAAVPEMRDRVADLATLLADAARERTILAEEMDRLNPHQDES